MGSYPLSSQAPTHVEVELGCDNLFVSVTLEAQGIMPGHDRNKNQCVFCNIILGQITLSPTESHLLHCTLRNS